MSHPVLSSLAPRGLSRVEAAGYVGVSPSLFDRLVKDCIMPKPIRFYGRVVWDRTRLDRVFAALADQGDVSADGGDDAGYDAPARL